MAAEALRRKSQLILNNIAPVTNTYDELVKQKLELGKFPTTRTGVIKLTGMSFIILGISVFLAQPRCEDTGDWYPYLLPISSGVTIFVQFLLFFIFAFGVTVKKPSFWIYSDVIIILFLSLTSLGCAVVTYKDCAVERAITKVPSPLVMAGSIILVISCGAIFLMYRYIDVQEEAPRSPIEHSDDHSPRKSIHV